MTYIVNPEQIEAWPLHEGVQGKILIDGQSMTAMLDIWAPKSEFATHSHPHEQLGICLQGEAVVTIDGREYYVKQGELYHVPANVPHGWRNDGDEPTVTLDVYSPVREDLLRRRFEQKVYE